MLARMVAVLALIWGGSAGADLVPPPPTSCPAGSQGSTCHGGPYCAPKKCTDYASCAAGSTCQPVQLCINKKNCTSGYGTYYADEVVGSCAGGTPCATGTCQTVVVCMQGTKDQGLKDRPPADRPGTADRPKTGDRPTADRPTVTDQPTSADRPTVADRPTSAEQSGPPPSSSGCNCGVAEVGGGGAALAGLIALALVLCGRRRSRH